MGFHVEEGSATRTPVFWFNHEGILSWCGKEVADLTKNDALKMRLFIESMSYQHGYFHAEEAPWNPFDAGLLFGEPFHLWNTGMAQGIADRENSVMFTGTPPRIHAKDEFDLQPCLVKKLAELAELAEQAYAQFAPAKKSLLRTLHQVMSAWHLGGKHAASPSHFSNQPDLIPEAR